MSGPVQAPVIAIDGPTASGKGAVSQRVAESLGWHYLDSGALYRLTALAARDTALAPEDEAALGDLARGLDVRFSGDRVALCGRDVTDDIRQTEIGAMASRIAALPAVRSALMARQRAFRRLPGLVADGRDMGTVVFPEAELKVFLTAAVEARAERRYKQLIEKGFSANLSDLLRDLRERDERDSSRSVAPLRPAGDAVIIDSSTCTLDEVVRQVLELHRRRAMGC
ncbi:MAG: (d)CMP kinase [Burkholderiaceae bacterium]|nr:(d)CMP kinase [Burkholderiaceae bacterium]